MQGRGPRDYVDGLVKPRVATPTVAISTCMCRQLLLLRKQGRWGGEGRDATCDSLCDLEAACCHHTKYSEIVGRIHPVRSFCPLAPVHSLSFVEEQGPSRHKHTGYYCQTIPERSSSRQNASAAQSKANLQYFATRIERETVLKWSTGVISVSIADEE